MERAILLGASNLTRSFRTVIDVVRQVRNSPLDVLTAFGYGRSYGLRSNVLGRQLPSILDCGIWESWKNLIPIPTFALITDIGNDLFYGAPVCDIVDWIDVITRRLRPNCERIVLALPPVENASHIAQWQFTAVKTLFFKGCRLGFTEIVDRAHELNAALIQLASELDLHIVKHSPSWYGLDPIHLKKSQWSTAWRTIFDHWKVESINQLYQDEKNSLDNHSTVVKTITIGDRLPAARLSWSQSWLRCWPESQILFGQPRLRSQPACRLLDGTRLSFF